MAHRISKKDLRGAASAYGKAAFFMGLPFIAIGSYLALAGFELIPLKGVANVPLWVLGWVGLAFAGPGFLLTGAAVQGLSAHRRSLRAAKRFPDQPWKYDYPWRPTGITDRTASRWMQSMFGAALFWVFLVPFVWWGFLSGEGPVLVQAIVGLFSLFGLFAIGKAFYQLAQWLKYGRSKLSFETFPWYPGQTVRVSLSPNPGGELQATLRFIEERYERTGSSDNSTTSLIAYQYQSIPQTIPEQSPAQDIAITLELPSDNKLATALSETPVRYWELHLQSETPGINYEASFPLPVYRNHPSLNPFGT